MCGWCTAAVDRTTTTFPRPTQRSNIQTYQVHRRTSYRAHDAYSTSKNSISIHKHHWNACVPPFRLETLPIRYQANPIIPKGKLVPTYTEKIQEYKNLRDAGGWKAKRLRHDMSGIKNSDFIETFYSTSNTTSTSTTLKFRVLGTGAVYIPSAQTYWHTFILAESSSTFDSKSEKLQPGIIQMTTYTPHQTPSHTTENPKNEETSKP